MVRIELFGVPRARAGVAEVSLAASTLGNALAELEARLPGLKGVCLQNGKLLPGYLANINGQKFTTDPATPLEDGASVLILSADVGG